MNQLALGVVALLAAYLLSIIDAVVFFSREYSIASLLLSGVLYLIGLYVVLDAVIEVQEMEHSS